MIPSKKLLLSDELNYFLDQCSNPVAWYYQHGLQEEFSFKVGLDNVMDMKHYILTEQYAENKPEYVWDLFLCNTHISFYYIKQDNLDKALEIINETEKILSKLTENSTIFLDSIKLALHHITITTKGYVLTKSHFKNSKQFEDSFVALHDMDAMNTAALYAVKSVFSGLYTNRWCILSKVCLVHAISLSPLEPEWHYMLSCCLTDYRKRLRFMRKVLPEELAEAKAAVRLSDRPIYKCNLAKLLHYNEYTESYGPDTIKAIQLIRDIVKCSDDVFILRRCLKILTKMSRIQLLDINIASLSETIISKIMNSNNNFVRDSIGYYYMHFEKDLEKAKIYLKVASDDKCFNASMNYMHLLFKLDPINTDIVKILDDYLNTYTFLSTRHTILCLVISYQLLNKKNIVGALKYIDEILDIKVVTFIRRMQNYRTKFYNPTQTFNLLTIIFDKLEKNLENKTLLPENLDTVKRLFNKINEFNTYVHSIDVKTEDRYYDLDTKIEFLSQNEMIEGKCCAMTYSIINNVRIKTSKERKTENWRTLKPNDGPNVFTLSKRQYFDTRRPM